VLRRNKFFFPALIVLMIVTMLCGIAFGAVSVLPSDMFASLQHFFSGKEPATIYEAVFIQLRLPRVLLCGITGAILAVSGVLMQGLFRNPIVEPGLVGTSSGAAFGASIVFVLAAKMSPEVKSYMGPLLLPVVAFLGALLATYVVYTLAKSSGRVSVLSLLLIGIAVNAVCLSGTGFMSYIARDPQARSITFWNLGTFSGASWMQVGIVGGVAAITFAITLRDAKGLNALLLGEQEANYLGIDTEKLKRRIMLLNTAMVAVATAFVGVIAFMGLIVPHLVRLMIGSDNRRLLPASALLGATLLVLADMAARLLLAPAEMPIGIITSLVGAPVFISILITNNRKQQKGGFYA
jgi:iron complex transport system permease protein